MWVENNILNIVYIKWSVAICLFMLTIRQICFNAREPDLIIIVPLLHFK